MHKLYKMAFEIVQRYGKDEDLTLIIKGCIKFRSELDNNPSHLPFPQESCCYSFKVESEGIKDLPLPLNLLFQLWDTAEGWTGKCAGWEQESVYGIGCGGLLANGGVMGHCIECHQRNCFNIEGLSRTGRDLESKITGYRYRISKAGYGMCFRGPKHPLYYRLKQLGYKHLPCESWLDGIKPDDASLTVKK